VSKRHLENRSLEDKILEYRSLEYLTLENLAYRMLGSVADAQDVVQEASLKVFKLDKQPRNLQAYLFRVVTNLALDRLRHEKASRAHYHGPWLPEPLPTDRIVELADSLSLGFLMMLERLSPAERVVFVLRNGFDLSFSEIAEVLEIEVAACRQRYRRAKQNISREKRFVTPLAEQKKLLDKLILAVAEEDLHALVSLFSDDAVAYTDGGGIVSAAIRPITGPQRIAQVMLQLARRAEIEGAISYREVALNGGVGLLIHQNGELHSCVQLDGEEGYITRLYVMRNPEKLAGMVTLSG